MPHDHEDIAAEDGVLRRISPNMIVDDGRGGKRLSSMAYKGSDEDRYHGMSMEIEKLFEPAGQDPRQCDPPWVACIRFEAGQLRAAGCRVGYDPIAAPPRDNPFHGEIWHNQSRAVFKAISRLAQHYVGLDGVSLVIP